ncbi:MAG: hypothetical protein KGJ80_18140, partial [Chloroflexota bacterium]|nr:hypothetical protein [Chloroflexota bacterium]
MIEIIVLILLTIQLGRIAKRKGHNATPYRVLTVVLWIGGEVIGVIVGAGIVGSSNLLPVYLFGL